MRSYKRGVNVNVEVEAREAQGIIPKILMHRYGYPVTGYPVPSTLLVYFDAYCKNLRAYNFVMISDTGTILKD